MILAIDVFAALRQNPCMSMRRYFSGILIGMALGINLCLILQKNLGWTTGDGSLFLLGAILLFIGIVVGALRLKKAGSGQVRNSSVE